MDMRWSEILDLPDEKQREVELRCALIALGEKCRWENAWLSSLPKGVAFNEIVKVASSGDLGIKLILELLVIDRRWYWLLALHKATGVVPFQESDSGMLDRICWAWERWGIEKGLITSHLVDTGRKIRELLELE
jgi:hypothetical protein